MTLTPPTFAREHSPMSSRSYAANTIKGQEHWTKKGSDVNLFLWEKRRP